MEESAMDPPQRANAAQMAARNIKAAKGGRGHTSRRLGATPKPNLQELGNQVPQFAPIPAADAQVPQQNGGLFGGSIQPTTGGFDFAAPGGKTISFAKATGNGSDISDTNDGIGRFPGDDRALKRRNGFNTTSQHNTPFKGFGSNPQTNLFGGPKPAEAAANNPFSFSGSGPAAAPSPSFNFNNPQASPAKPTFTFGATSQPTPASPAVSFGSNTTGDQAGNTSFNSNPPQSQGSSFFGSAQQNTPFQFSSNTAPPTSTIINVTNTPSTSAPTSNLFGNTSASGPSSNSSMIFGAKSSTAQPMSNLFGTSNPSASSATNIAPTPTSKTFSNLFGTTQTSQAPAPSNLLGATGQPPSSTSGVFSGFNAPASPAPESSWNQGQATASTSNLFGAQNPPVPQSGAPTSNLFGTQTPPVAQSNNLFGNHNSIFSKPESSTQPVSSVAPTSSLFNSPSKPEARNNFFGASAQETSQMNVNGNTENGARSTNDLFGNLNRPVDASVKANGITASTQSSNIFGASKPLFSTSSASLNSRPNVFGDNGKDSLSEGVTKDNNKASHSPFSFGKISSPTKESSNSKNIFSSSTSLDLPSAANQPPPNGMFPALSQTTPQENSNLNSQSSDPDNAPTMAPYPLNPKALQKFLDSMKVVLDWTDDFLRNDYGYRPDLRARVEGDELYERKYLALVRIKELNRYLHRMWGEIPWDSDPAPALFAYMKTRMQILKMYNLHEPYDPKRSKRKEREEDEEENARPQKRSSLLLKSIAEARSKQTPAATSDKPDADINSSAEANKHAGLFAASSSGTLSSQGASVANGVPQATPARSMNPFDRSSQSSNPLKNALNSANSLPKNPSAPFASGASERNMHMAKPPQPVADSSSSAGTASPYIAQPPSKGKRKAEDELTQNTESVNPLRAIKTPKLKGSFATPNQDSNEGSNTSALFRGILNSPAKSGTSPEKTAENKQPRINPFGSIKVAQAPTLEASSSASPVKLFGTNTATSSQPSLFTITGAATASPSNKFTPEITPNFSQPNMFATDKSSAPAPTNLFAAASNTSNAPTNPFQFKPTSNTNGQGESKPANPFQLKPTSNSANGAGESSGSIVPPKFGSLSGMSAIEQFREKAKKDEAAKEKKKMEEDKDAEWESEDESESEYERKWYARRAEEKKQQEQESLKTAAPKFMYNPAKAASNSTSKESTSSRSPSKDQDETINAASTSLFAQYTSNNSAGNSMNGSRTSTPGLLGSASGSILGGSGLGQPVKNIFGHLSDTGSGKDDKDDDSDADDEDDSENKDPNYFPSAENGSGPGTPADETGAGIASARKPALFGFSNGPSFGATSTSGTSTPGRSLFDRIGPKPAAEPQEEEKADSRPMTGGLFDRITKDSNGNPLRHVSSEEKENTQPSSSNAFSGSFGSGLFSRSSAAPADRTWKQDSPIKFGSPSTAEDKDATPTVSFTAPTPTKTPRGYFGGDGTDESPSVSAANSSSSKPTASLFSGLSGSNGIINKGTSTPSVGFAFGAAPITTTSLFPSVAGSAATSRGTSPGVTTDGASDADADPDVEHHEQINLTTGGPGEEDEEVAHEVRAKALRYGTENGKNKWETVGLGPLRVLKHKETGVSRVLLRGDPSGKVVLNKGILGNLTYSAEGKTVKFLATEKGNLETFLLQVKTPDFAQKLADVLNENKAA